MGSSSSSVVVDLPVDAGLGRGEQDPAEFDATALATGEGAQRLAEHPVLQTEVRADPRRVALRRVSARGGEAVFEPAVAADRRVALVLVDQFGHRGLRLFHLAQEFVEPARGEHAILGGDRKITFARILWQVADFADADGARERLALAGEYAQGGGLAGAVAPDEADPVARLDAQVGVVEQDARPSPQFEIRCGDHE